MGLKNMAVILTFTYLMVYATEAREVFMMNNINNIAARLETSGGLVDCWNALAELKSCSNEIVLFFINGQADIGPDCCRAIEIITHNCWPAMLSSLGFTAEEGNILRGYCDAAASAPAVAPSPTPGVSVP
ncbi:egg cell-secreted protein 1.1-like [Quillaja saponaria]|uniref:Egg cell-secreted protein 1.1-like n=1 Tax=Quillaja saponaria TaxID=32244 RepID=A0AAD7LGH8_QUISA|nr:egg cell-secreted protein 1.1-like [Quillaja saponaria]